MALPPPVPPALPEELVEQILLHFPPSDPASLVRAALVCKTWCRLVAGLGFHRRFRQFHRTPPVLGFLRHVVDGGWSCIGTEFAHFVPISSFRPPLAYCSGCRAIDARHGRVLLHRWTSASPFRNASFAIWDPITVERVELPIRQGLYGACTWQAAVLCACCDACGHLDCRGEHFQVVLVAAFHQRVHAYVYSPEAGAWHQLKSHLLHPNAGFNIKVPSPSALVENALYFILGLCSNLLRYNLVTQEMSVIDLPPAVFGQRIVLTTTEDGRLGCIMVQGFKVYLWSREAGPEGDAGWTQSRFIKLEKLIPFNPRSISPSMVGYVDGNGTGVAFVHTGDGLLIIDLKSSQVKNVGKFSGNSRIFPFTSFWTPEIGVGFTGEGQGVGALSSQVAGVGFKKIQ